MTNSPGKSADRGSDAESRDVRVGAIDCGTNSIRLLIADRRDGALSYVERRTEVVRLGAGVDITGRINAEAMERTLRVAREYAQLCRTHDVEAVRFVATSASRDAENAAEFVAGVKSAFGDYDVAPEVISGDEEAQLSFVGATGGLRADGVPAPYLVVDLGGGSTELVRGEAAAEAAYSMDIGSVRMTERHFHEDPPTSEQIAAATKDIEAALDVAEAHVGLDGIATLVGVAGSITTITAHALELPKYDSEKIHGAVLTVDQALASCARVLAADRPERSSYPFMHPGRVDVIAAGALIWKLVIERVQARSGISRVRTSETDILDGIALSIQI